MTDRTHHLRPARHGDRQAMLDITRNVWDGEDYLPFVWDRWISGADGFLHVAVVGGQVVGVQHVKVMPDGTAWLEGIRVREDVRGQGVGAALLEYGMAWASSLGCRVARLSTWNGNDSSRRLTEKGGLKVIATFDILSAPAVKGADHGSHVRLALPSDIDEVYEMLHVTGNSDSWPRFYSEGWTIHGLTRERLLLLLATSAVCMCGEFSGGALAVVTSPVDQPTVRIGLLTGDPQGVTRLCQWLLDRAFNADVVMVRAIVESDPSIRDVLIHSGFTGQKGSALLLHERNLPSNE